MAYRSKRWRERQEYDPLDPAKQHAPSQAGTLVAGYLDRRMLTGASDASRALMTWRRIAGKRAAKHTVAVWLNQPKKGPGLPELVVYLDGNALMADLTTNSELFADRLAWAGLPVAKVRFKLSRKAGQPREDASLVGGSISRGTAAAPKSQPLPPLTALEQAEVAAACSKLPEKLRESAYEAMSLSLRRQKVQTTNEAASGPERSR